MIGAAVLCYISAFNPPSIASQIVEGAKIQVREAARYDPSYRKIGYPEGDIPRTIGVCTDVVIRSLRHAGFDLQKLIHRDMKLRFASYPRKGARPDTNIDHRRVPNQVHFFKKYGIALPTHLQSSTWNPGDIVYWKLDNGLDHVGILSNTRGPSGAWKVVHNLRICSEEDVLGSWRILGHYRFPRTTR